MVAPFDFMGILKVAAPIVASAFCGSNDYEYEERDYRRREVVQAAPVTNNTTTINISITNNFYNKSEMEAMTTASEIQNKMLESFSSGERFKL